jgi:hypothetical protein
MHLPVTEPEQEAAMDTYNLTGVQSMTTPDGLGYGFNIVGVHDRPLVNFAYEHPDEAQAAHKLIAKAIIEARLITPMVQP